MINLDELLVDGTNQISLSSHTNILHRLLTRNNHFWQLEYLDLSGCSLVTDRSLQRIAQALSRNHQPRPPSCSHCPLYVAGRCDAGACVMGWNGLGEVGGGARGVASGREQKSPQLKCLILSGCHRLTDEGLR